MPHTRTGARHHEEDVGPSAFRIYKAPLLLHVHETADTMASNLRLEVIAEGVETEEQMKFLCSVNCHQMQGDFFSKPISAEEISPLIRKPFCKNTRAEWKIAVSSDPVGLTQRKEP